MVMVLNFGIVEEKDRSETGNREPCSDFGIPRPMVSPPQTTSVMV